VGSIPVANPTPPRKLRLSRRALIAGLALLTVAVAIVGTTAFAWPNDSAPPTHEWVLLGNVDDLPVGEPVTLEEPDAYLVGLDGGRLFAFSRRSTHLGCTVVWRPDREFSGAKGFFSDPCGGALWAIDGTPAFGPAPRGMDRYPVAVVNGEVSVDTRNLICGFGYEDDARPLPCVPLEQYRQRFPNALPPPE
jgi:nitrite reductase/ring-hydroxylating ferredoxin subunit